MAQNQANPIIAFGDTLENDIKCFTETLPNFAKYLSKKILANEEIGANELILAYDYFKEEFGLKQKTNLSPIEIDCISQLSSQFIGKLRLERLDNIEGVNALVSNQAIEFNSGLTIIYGINGSGKSGYTLLLKKAFFSRDKEEISPNIYQEEANRSVSATFHFISEGTSQTYKYPVDKNNAAFLQFAVFDKKCALTHLDGKNEYEFKPSGLQFFSALIEQFKRLEELISRDVQENSRTINFDSFFYGDSEIKLAIKNIFSNLSVALVKKYLPFTEEEKSNFETLKGKRAILASSDIDKEIRRYTELKGNFNKLEQSLRSANKYFTKEAIDKVKTAISKYIEKEKQSKTQGKESFRLLVNYSVENSHWLEFVEAAGRFAESINNEYPKEFDKCLLCQQTLTPEANQLIHKYWEYLDSQAEKNFKNAQEKIEQIKKAFIDLKLDFLDEGCVSHQWLKENDSTKLEVILDHIQTLSALKDNLLVDLAALTIQDREEIQMDLTSIQDVQTKFEEKIQGLIKSNVTTEIRGI